MKHAIRLLRERKVQCTDACEKLETLKESVKLFNIRESAAAEGCRNTMPIVKEAVTHCRGSESLDTLSELQSIVMKYYHEIVNEIVALKGDDKHGT